MLLFVINTKNVSVVQNKQFNCMLSVLTCLEFPLRLEMNCSKNYSRKLAIE